MRGTGATPGQIRRRWYGGSLRVSKKAANVSRFEPPGGESVRFNGQGIGSAGYLSHMNLFAIFVRRALLLLVLALGPAAGMLVPGFIAASSEAATVSSIVVTGNTRIDASTVKSYVLIVPGKSFGSADIDESVKSLYGTGLFSDVTINVSGSRLVVKVVENPIVNRVLIRGNKKVKSNVLMPLLQTKPRGVLTDAKLQGDVQAITDYYATQGRSLASVTPEVTPLADNRVDVTIQINEGARTGVGTITFVGNSAFSDSRLRSVINTKVHGLLSWLNRKDVYSEAKLAADQESLRRFYLSHGYADFRVISVDTDFNEAKGRYHIVFTIEEGDKYRFSTVNVDSTIPGVDGSALRRFVETRPGAVFDAVDIEKSVEALTIEVSRLGHPFVQVRPRGDRNYENHTISVTYLVDEGPRLYVERIEILGNTKTRDYVIRREFDFSEGDPYNRVLVDKAERKLRNLGYFKSVLISTEPGSSPDRVVVIVSIEEDATGDISLGGGISTEGLVAEISLNERNFLGRGQQLRISVGYGSDQQAYNLSFTDPYFLGYNISAGFDAYMTQQDSSNFRPFDNEIIGGAIRLGLPITDDLRFNLNYKIFNQSISNSTLQAYFPNGDYLTSSAGYSVVYSTLDNKTDPREGMNIVLQQDFAGIGGDARYMKSQIDARYYQDIFPDADIIGILHAGAGNITGLGQPIAAIDAFFKGPDLVRGFEAYGIGPVDPATGIPIGANNFWMTSAEVQFPLPLLPPDFGLRGAVFADAGSAWGSDYAVDPSNVIRSSVGASIMWASPIGLLRGDFAQAITKADTDKTQFFRFSAGKTF